MKRASDELLKMQQFREQAIQQNKDFRTENLRDYLLIDDPQKCQQFKTKNPYSVEENEMSQIASEGEAIEQQQIPKHQTQQSGNRYEIEQNQRQYDKQPFQYRSHPQKKESGTLQSQNDQNGPFLITPNQNFEIDSSKQQRVLVKEQGRQIDKPFEVTENDVMVSPIRKKNEKTMKSQTLMHENVNLDLQKQQNLNNNLDNILQTSQGDKTWSSALKTSPGLSFKERVASGDLRKQQSEQNHHLIDSESGSRPKNHHHSGGLQSIQNRCPLPKTKKDNQKLPQNIFSLNSSTKECTFCMSQNLGRSNQCAHFLQNNTSSTESRKNSSSPKKRAKMGTYPENPQQLIQRSLHNKYENQNDEFHNLKVVNDLIYNEQTHLVSIFKEYLIWDDINEFLKRPYQKEAESQVRLPRLCEFYNKYSQVFPSFVNLPEGKFMFKNIQKKQKLIDDYYKRIQADEERGVSLRPSLNDSGNRLLNSQFMNSIMRAKKLMPDQSALMTHVQSADQISIELTGRSLQVDGERARKWRNKNGCDETASLNCLVEEFFMKDSDATFNVDQSMGMPFGSDNAFTERQEAGQRVRQLSINLDTQDSVKEFVLVSEKKQPPKLIHQESDMISVGALTSEIRLPSQRPQPQPTKKMQVDVLKAPQNSAPRQQKKNQPAVSNQNYLQKTIDRTLGTRKASQPQTGIQNMSEQKIKPSPLKSKRPVIQKKNLQSTPMGKNLVSSHRNPSGLKQIQQLQSSRKIAKKVPQQQGNTANERRTLQKVQRTNQNNLQSKTNHFAQSGQKSLQNQRNSVESINEKCLHNNYLENCELFGDSPVPSSRREQQLGEPETGRSSSPLLGVVSNPLSSQPMLIKAKFPTRTTQPGSALSTISNPKAISGLKQTESKNFRATPAGGTVIMTQTSPMTANAKIELLINKTPNQFDIGVAHRGSNTVKSAQQIHNSQNNQHPTAGQSSQSFAKKQINGLPPVNLLQATMKNADSRTLKKQRKSIQQQVETDYYHTGAAKNSNLHHSSGAQTAHGLSNAIRTHLVPNSFSQSSTNLVTGAGADQINNKYSIHSQLQGAKIGGKQSQRSSENVLDRFNSEKKMKKVPKKKQTLGKADLNTVGTVFGKSLGERKGTVEEIPLKVFDNTEDSVAEEVQDRNGVQSQSETEDELEILREAGDIVSCHDQFLSGSLLKTRESCQLQPSDLLQHSKKTNYGGLANEKRQKLRIVDDKLSKMTNNNLAQSSGKVIIRSQTAMNNLPQRFFQSSQQMYTQPSGVAQNLKQHEMVTQVTDLDSVHSGMGERGRASLARSQITVKELRSVKTTHNMDQSQKIGGASLASRLSSGKNSMYNTLERATGRGLTQSSMGVIQSQGLQRMSKGDGLKSQLQIVLKEPLQTVPGSKVGSTKGGRPESRQRVLAANRPNTNIIGRSSMSLRGDTTNKDGVVVQQKHKLLNNALPNLKAESFIAGSTNQQQKMQKLQKISDAGSKLGSKALINQIGNKVVATSLRSSFDPASTALSSANLRQTALTHAPPSLSVSKQVSKASKVSTNLLGLTSSDQQQTLQRSQLSKRENPLNRMMVELQSVGQQSQKNFQKRASNPLNQLQSPQSAVQQLQQSRALQQQSQNNLKGDSESLKKQVIQNAQQIQMGHNLRKINTSKQTTGGYFDMIEKQSAQEGSNQQVKQFSLSPTKNNDGASQKMKQSSGMMHSTQSQVMIAPLHQYNSQQQQHQQTLLKVGSRNLTSFPTSTNSQHNQFSVASQQKVSQVVEMKAALSRSPGTKTNTNFVKMIKSTATLQKQLGQIQKDMKKNLQKKNFNASLSPQPSNQSIQRAGNGIKHSSAMGFQSIKNGKNNLEQKNGMILIACEINQKQAGASRQQQQFQRTTKASQATNGAQIQQSSAFSLPKNHQSLTSQKRGSFASTSKFKILP